MDWLEEDVARVRGRVSQKIKKMQDGNQQKDVNMLKKKDYVCKRYT